MGVIVVCVELAVNLIIVPPSSPTPRRQPGLESRIDPRSARPMSTHPKGSVPSGVASFLRRATGRKSPEPLSGHDGSKAIKTSTHDPIKRGGIPRILKKKASELFSVRTNSKRVEKDPAPASSRPGTASSNAYHTRQPPHSPTQSVRQTEIPTFPPKIDISSISDISDDGNMHSTKDIRAAIAAIEAEAERVLEAFNNLEMTTSQRIHQQTVRRLPSATPSHANVLIEGREWRDHSFQPPSSPRVSDRKRRIPPAIDVSDGASVRSGSSIKTSLSQSKSVSSLRSKHHPGSPLAPRFPTPPPLIHHKNSVSSISSQTPSSQRLGANRSLSLSRSTGHLPLSMVAEREGMLSRDSVAGWGTDDGDVPAEVVDIRKRSREVAARYEARLEYLQAKLKGAKLHEKLIRK